MLSEKAAPAFTLLWRQDGSDGVAWHLRGVQAGGSFYGEVRYQHADEARCISVLASGRLSPQDSARLRQLVEVIRGAPPDQSRRGRFAVLFERLAPTSSGEGGLFFTYRLGDEAVSAAARAFLEVVELVERYLFPFYARLVAPDPAT